MRRAIVTTSMGCEGFEVESGREMVLADAPEAFASSVIDLLADPIRRTRMGQSGHAFVLASYDWSVIVPRLAQVLTNLRPARG